MFRVNLSTDTPRDKVETEMRRTHVRWDELISYRLLTISDFIDKFHFINNGCNARSRVCTLLGFCKEESDTIPVALVKILMDNGYSNVLYSHAFATPSDLVKLIDSQSTALNFVHDDFERLTTEEQVWLINTLHKSNNIKLTLFNVLLNKGSHNKEVLKVLKDVFMYSPDFYNYCPKMLKHISEAEFLTMLPKANASTILNYVPYLTMSVEYFNKNILPHLKGTNVEKFEEKYHFLIASDHKDAANKYLLPMCSYMFQQQASGDMDWKAISENMDNMSIEERCSALCNPSAPGWFLKDNIHFMLQMQMLNQQNMLNHNYSYRGGYSDPRHPHNHMFYKG